MLALIRLMKSDMAPLDASIMSTHWMQAATASVRVVRARPRRPACTELIAGTSRPPRTCEDSNITVGSGSRLLVCNRKTSRDASATASGSHDSPPREETRRCTVARSPPVIATLRYRVAIGVSTEPGDEESDCSSFFASSMLPLLRGRTFINDSSPPPSASYRFPEAHSWYQRLPVTRTRTGRRKDSALCTVFSPF
eukprot:scaffold22390_cov28-Tisochrysis_lutea.AAC.11